MNEVMLPFLCQFIGQVISMGNSGEGTGIEVMHLSQIKVTFQEIIFPLEKIQDMGSLKILRLSHEGLHFVKQLFEIACLSEDDTIAGCGADGLTEHEEII